MSLWRWIGAVAASVLCSALLVHLSGSLPLPENWALPAKLDNLVRAAPSPTQVALRKKLSEMGDRAGLASADARDLAAAKAFYDAYNGLLWVTDGRISERGHSVIGEIRRADHWGLRARDFALPKSSDGPLALDAAAGAEITVTLAVLKYARYARGGRFGDLARISKVVDYKAPLRRGAEVLTEIAASGSPDAYLRSLHPRHDQFQALRQLLLQLRGPDATAGTEAGTQAADKAVTLARILVNMERWRWLPEDLGDFHVWNNVPEFVTRVVRRGEVIHADRIVVGLPDWPTPVFSADMRTIVFHPSWGVPDGIKRKELLPRLRESSQGGGLFGLLTGTPSSGALLKQLKLEAYHQGRPIDPDKVDWSTANIAAYEFRQPPGPLNPLGVVKFMFPNRHDVYMHDTTKSERSVFARSFRGFSHGCMRVAEPRRLAAILLAHDKGWSEQQVESLLQGGTREVALTTRIPVHMTYFTAMVDHQGRLHTLGDLYGLDTRMGALLFGTKSPFVTPSYAAEIKAMRERPEPGGGSSGTTTLAEVIASIFSP